MKFSVEDVEIRVLKHLTSYKDAFNKAEIIGIESDHFQHIAEGEKQSYTQVLYKILRNYYTESDTSLVNDYVFESQLVKFNIKDKNKAIMLNLWEHIKEEEHDPNELHELLTELKSNRAMRYYNQLYKSGHVFMQENGLSEWVEFNQDILNNIIKEIHQHEQQNKVIDIDEVNENFEKDYRDKVKDKNMHIGIPCGIHLLDEASEGFFKRGGISIWVAPSGGGKSIQLLTSALFAYNNANANVLCISFELDEEQCKTRYISNVLSIPEWKLSTLNLDDTEILNVALDLKNKNDGKTNYFKFVIAVEDKTVEYVEAIVRELCLTKGKPDLVILDYIGEMTSRTLKPSDPVYVVTDVVTSKLKTLAMKYKIAIGTAQQLTSDTARESGKAKNAGKKFIYNEASLSGGKMLLNRSHFTVLMEPDRANGMTIYTPLKIRSGKWFSPFVAKVIPEYNQIVNLTQEEQEVQQRLRGLNIDIQSTDDKDSYAVDRASEVFEEENQLLVVNRGGEERLDYSSLELSDDDLDITDLQFGVD